MVKKHNRNKEYKRPTLSNRREAFLAEQLDREGYVVLKNGWPDFFCYNPATGKARLIEVKSRSQYSLKIRQNGKISETWGLSQDQLRMHQYLKKIGLDVEIHWVE